ncbi:MAG TPA: PTS sugar transporter subunit IIA [Candidatus Limnocylindria bacterium]|nr:PTS sugar transporter subunit IIA [Candidatus Limnocylindria bacterium]
MRPFDVVVVSHGGLADAMVAAASMICGDLERVTPVGLDPTDSPETFGERLAAAIDDTHPTLILSDLYGGTPHNVACVLAQRGRAVRCISGTNLGLLIEAVSTSEELDDQLVDRLISLAREGVVDVTSRLSLSRD